MLQEEASSTVKVMPFLRKDKSTVSCSMMVLPVDSAAKIPASALLRLALVLHGIKRSMEANNAEAA
ncbi:MAG: hypothetical protein H0X24_02630 [Ktedonobacterales bacterium]|nr:hypothetical protein [Ktedonobacterales bacterium]